MYVCVISHIHIFSNLFHKKDRFKVNFEELLDASITLLGSDTAETISQERKTVLFNELILCLFCVPKVRKISQVELC